jgi:hypothetical chaperone protein
MGTVPGPKSLGLDFGTTNTVLSWAAPRSGRPVDGAFATPRAEPVVFHFLTSLLFAFRSALCFWDEGDETHPQVVAEAGPWAIQSFLEHASDCRFIQSLKSFAASRLFETTGIYGRAYRFEDLFAAFFERVRAHASPQLDALPREVIVGRPVAYAGSRPDPALAMKRYEAALAPFGFERIRQVYEPVAAAFFYAQSLEESATVLVADFGGGTTDYSVISFEQRAAGCARRRWATRAWASPGDRFDYRIIDHVVLPQLGKGTTYRSMGKQPRAAALVLRGLRALARALGHEDLARVPGAEGSARLQRRARARGTASSAWWNPTRAIRSTRPCRTRREALSREESARFSFQGPGFHDRDRHHARAVREWIAEELAAIEATLDRVLANASIGAADVDRVFLTGGSSFVPAVRAIFERRFGADRVEAGNEFVSIANGLANDRAARRPWMNGS